MDTGKNQNDTTIDNILKVGVKGQIFIANILATRKTTSHFRVIVESGGCSGFVYRFSVEEDDLIIESDTIICENPKIVVDAVSLLYISGSVLDLEESISGNRLVLNNPHTVQSCGCGISFTLEK